MAWDDVQIDGHIVTSDEWNAMVTFIKALLVRTGGTLTGALINTAVTFDDLDLTPDVSGGNVFQTANSGATVITDFNEGTEGQLIHIMFGDGDTSIAHGGNIHLIGGAQLDFTLYETITLMYVGAVWCEMR
jgi:hypothetical protein